MDSPDASSPSIQLTPAPEIGGFGDPRSGNWDNPFDEFKRAPASGGVADLGHPFKVFDASVPSPAAAKVRVAYGTVNNFVPTIGGNSIFIDPAPELTVVSGEIYLDATVDGAGAVTAVVISNAAATPSDTATNKYRLIASVTVSGGVVTAISNPQSVITSLTLYLCNGTAIWEGA